MNEARKAQARAAQYFAGMNAIVCHPPIVLMCAGDYNAAAILEQILYWTPRAADPDGWIAKTYEEWAKETHKSDRTVAKIITRLEAAGLIETHVHRSPFYQYQPVQHVRIGPKFDEALDTALEELDSKNGNSGKPNLGVPNEKPNLGVPKQNPKRAFHLSEPTAELSTEGVHAPAREELPPPGQRCFRGRCP